MTTSAKKTRHAPRGAASVGTLTEAGDSGAGAGTQRAANAL
jgi:hypothetical protein